MNPRLVLVADAHDDSRIIYSTILQYAGFAILEARSGAEALEMVSEHTPDAVIAEFRLPVIDGCEVLRRMRRHPLTSHIPVLIVTADVRTEVRREATEAGCQVYLLKPCVPLELLTAVQNVLDQTILPTLVSPRVTRRPLARPPARESSRPA